MENLKKNSGIKTLSIENKTMICERAQKTKRKINLVNWKTDLRKSFRLYHSALKTWKI